MQMFLKKRVKKLLDAQEIGKIRLDNWEAEFISDMHHRNPQYPVTPLQKEKINQVWEKYERDAL